MAEPDIDAILRGGRYRRRWLVLSFGAAVVVIEAVVAFLLTRPDDVDVIVEPERIQATAGRVINQVQLSGSAEAERSTTLSFEVAGVVSSVEVTKGHQVRTGDVLARFDDTEAQRRVETSAVQLRQAQLRLEALLADPEGSAVASANQAIVSAKSQVMAAEQSLATLSDPPSVADLAGTEQAVATAPGQLSSAEQALSLLSEPPSAAELASAEQAVATALGQPEQARCCRNPRVAVI